MFINLPVISKFEWHPFTISSAPERQDVLTFHIRSVGGWTNKLHEYFVEENGLIEDERAGRVRAREGRSMIPRYEVACVAWSPHSGEFTQPHIHQTMTFS